MSRHGLTTPGGVPSPPARPRRHAGRALGILLVAILVLAPAAWAFSRSRPARLWSAARALERGEPDRALDRLGPWKTSDDTGAVSLVAQAQAARGYPESAVRLLEARLRGRAEPDWLGLLGELYLGLGRPDRALEAFEALDARRPDRPETLARIAGLARSIRGPAEADLLYKRLERLEPENPEWPRRRGLILLETDRYAMASVAFRSALDRDPEDPDARIWLAEALYLAGDPEAGLEELERCRADGPDDRVEVAQAECLRALGRTAEAASTLDGVLSRSPRDADALRLSAELALGGGEQGRALALLERAVAEAPGDWRIHYQLSIVLARLGRVEDPRRHSERMESERERSRFSPAP